MSGPQSIGGSAWYLSGNLSWLAHICNQVRTDLGGISGPREVGGWHSRIEIGLRLVVATNHEVVAPFADDITAAFKTIRALSTSHASLSKVAVYAGR